MRKFIHKLLGIKCKQLDERVTLIENIIGIKRDFMSIGEGNTGSGNVGDVPPDVARFQALLKAKSDGNVGDGNVGSGNVGSGNVGSGNVGSGSTKTQSLCPPADGNVGSGNVGSGNVGGGSTKTQSLCPQADGNVGGGNVGNVGSGNV